MSQRALSRHNGITVGTSGKKTPFWQKALLTFLGCILILFGVMKFGPVHNPYDGSGPRYNGITGLIADLNGQLLDAKLRIVSWLKNERGRAEQGNAHAQFKVGMFYINGAGGYPKNTSEGVRWLKLAADQGHIMAMSALGKCYFDGDGTPRNYLQAMRWFLKAADAGDTFGTIYIGIMLENGFGVPRDVAGALEWYRKAAERGEVKAQWRMGYLYEYGIGVEPNPSEAMLWFNKAAAQGDPEAMNEIGLKYEHGRGVMQDYAKALQWYRGAARWGNLNAVNNIGLAYRNGRGVERNDTEALKWHNQAAELGLAKAQLDLGSMYDTGKALPKDGIQATIWFARALANNPPPSTALTTEYKAAMTMRSSSDKEGAAAYFLKSLGKSPTLSAQISDEELIQLAREEWQTKHSRSNKN